MKIGDRVNHKLYGMGTVISVEDSVKLGDNKTWPRESQSSITRSTNGWSRYTGRLNVGIKFDSGGPQGFAFDSTNEIIGNIAFGEGAELASF